jgi:hypothetical protein
MFLSVLNPKANEGSEEDYRGNNVEHEANEIGTDGFEVKSESSHDVFPFVGSFVEVVLRGSN